MSLWSNRCLCCRKVTCFFLVEVVVRRDGDIGNVPPVGRWGSSPNLRSKFGCCCCMAPWKAPKRKRGLLSDVHFLKTLLESTFFLKFPEMTIQSLKDHESSTTNECLSRGYAFNSMLMTFRNFYLWLLYEMKLLLTRWAEGVCSELFMTMLSIIYAISCRNRIGTTLP